MQVALAPGLFEGSEQAASRRSAVPGGLALPVEALWRGRRGRGHSRPGVEFRATSQPSPLFWFRKGIDALLPFAAALLDFLLQVVEGNECQHCLAQLGVFVLINAPEAIWG